MERFPIVAMGSAFWGEMRNFIRGTLVPEETISAADLELLHVTDSPKEAVAYVRDGAARASPASTGTVD